MTKPLSPSELKKLKVEVEREAKRRVEENQLAHYVPYGKQATFHAAAGRE
jgi:hypothetical protein